MRLLRSKFTRHARGRRSAAAFAATILLVLPMPACDHRPVVDFSTDAAPDLNSAHRDGGTHCDGRGVELGNLTLAYEPSGDAGGPVLLRVVDADPEVPIVGNNSWLVEVLVDGVPYAGAEDVLVITPFMPDHNHGTPTLVNVTEEEPGQYRLAPIHTRMAGYWEVGIELEELATRFTVGVCVD